MIAIWGQLMKIEHEPDISKNCSINATSPCDADCVIVYSIITVLPSELVPAIFGRDNTTINGPLLLLLPVACGSGSVNPWILPQRTLRSSPVKVIAVLGLEAANNFLKRFTNSWVPMVPAVRTGRSENRTVSLPIVARNV